MITDILKKYCDEYEIAINDEQLSQFETYARLLVDWNERMNLTSITDEEGIAVKHFLDSVLMIKYAEIKGRVIDIGTGAGFPGVPLKIMRPDIELTLLDSLNKRLVFLDEVCREIGINAGLVHSRAEDGARQEAMREKYDLAVSRAVAALPALCEYCLPYVRVGGNFISMKGPDAPSEIEASKNALGILGGRLVRTEDFSLPDGSRRALVMIEKHKSTPVKYPRRGTKINKSPL